MPREQYEIRMSDAHSIAIDIAKRTAFSFLWHGYDQKSLATNHTSMMEFWNLFSNSWFSGYSFYSKLATAIADASLALNRAFGEDYTVSNDRISAEKKGMASARDIFENRFTDPEFLKSLAQAVNDYSKWAKVSGYGLMYQNLSNMSSLWNNAFIEPVRDRLERTPSHKIHSEGNFALFHYDRQGSRGVIQKTPLLVVYAFINRHYILDLLPDVSIIRNLLNQGFDVYATDWGTPGPYDKELTIGHYVNSYLDRSVDYVKRHSNSEKVSILGYCWGGDLALMYASLHPDKVANILTLATPGDFSLDNSLLAQWTRSIDADAIVAAFGNAPSALLNAAFGLRSPIDIFHKYPHFFENLRDLESIKKFFATETWLYDSPPVPGEIYKQFVNDCYKNNLLIQNKMIISNNQRVDLTNIKAPYLNVIASNDDLVAPVSSRAINNVIGSSDKTILEIKSGHVGACISPKAHSELWPRVGLWLKEHFQPAFQIL